jgi:hypothetical protein
VRSHSVPISAAAASPAEITNETRHPWSAPTAARTAAMVRPPENATPNMPMAKPLRLGPASVPTAWMPAGK